MAAASAPSTHSDLKLLEALMDERTVSQAWHWLCTVASGLHAVALCCPPHVLWARLRGITKRRSAEMPPPAIGAVPWTYHGPYHADATLRGTPAFTVRDPWLGLGGYVALQLGLALAAPRAARRSRPRRLAATAAVVFGAQVVAGRVAGGQRTHGPGQVAMGAAASLLLWATVSSVYSIHELALLRVLDDAKPHA